MRGNMKTTPSKDERDYESIETITDAWKTLGVNGNDFLIDCLHIHYTLHVKLIIQPTLDFIRFYYYFFSG